MMKTLDRGQDAAERIAIDALVWLTQDEERLLTFFQETGFAPENIRAASRDPGFLGGVLDHVVGEEERLVQCARGLDVPPERISSAWGRLQPAEFDHTA